MIFGVHYPDWPCKLIILNSKGEEIGKYWNAGYLMDYVLADLNNDQQMDLLVSGMNNEYGKPCIIVFEPKSIRGCSPQISIKYKWNFNNEGSEKYYILLPRCDVDLALHPIVEGIGQLDILSDEVIQAIAQNSRIIYQFKYDMFLFNLILSNEYKRLHESLKHENLIFTDINSEDYSIKIINGILYWNKRDWVHYRTLSNAW